MATLQICGEWGSGNDDATLEMSTERVWVQGRAPQKRLTALQARNATPAACITAHHTCHAAGKRKVARNTGDHTRHMQSTCIRDHQATCHAPPNLSAQGVADTELIERRPMQNMWNRNNGTAQEAFALRFIFTTQEQREVTFRNLLRLPRLLRTPASEGSLVLWT